MQFNIPAKTLINVKKLKRHYNASVARRLARTPKIVALKMLVDSGISTENVHQAFDQIDARPGKAGLFGFAGKVRDLQGAIVDQIIKEEGREKVGG